MCGRCDKIYLKYIKVQVKSGNQINKSKNHVSSTNIFRNYASLRRKVAKAQIVERIKVMSSQKKQNRQIKGSMQVDATFLIVGIAAKIYLTERLIK